MISLSCRRRRSWRLKPRPRVRRSCGAPWPACRRTFRSFPLFATCLYIKLSKVMLEPLCKPSFACIHKPCFRRRWRRWSRRRAASGAATSTCWPPSGRTPSSGSPPPWLPKTRYTGLDPVQARSLRDARLAATLAARDQVPQMQRCPACCVMRDSAALITGAARLAAKDQAPQVRHAQFVGAEWQPGAAEHAVLGHRRRNGCGHSWWRSTSSGRRRRRQSTQPRCRGCSSERRSSSSPGRRRRRRGQQLSQAWSRPSVMLWRSWKPRNSSPRCGLVPVM